MNKEEALSIAKQVINQKVKDATPTFVIDVRAQESGGYEVVFAGKDKLGAYTGKELVAIGEAIEVAQQAVDEAHAQVPLSFIYKYELSNPIVVELRLTPKEVQEFSEDTMRRQAFHRAQDKVKAALPEVYIRDIHLSLMEEPVYQKETRSVIYKQH